MTRGSGWRPAVPCLILRDRAAADYSAAFACVLDRRARRCVSRAGPGGMRRSKQAFLTQIRQGDARRTRGWAGVRHGRSRHRHRRTASREQRRCGSPGPICVFCVHLLSSALSACLLRCAPQRCRGRPRLAACKAGPSAGDEARGGRAVAFDGLGIRTFWRVCWAGPVSPQDRKCLTKLREAAGSIHKEGPLLSRRMAGTGDGWKAL